MKVEDMEFAPWFEAHEAEVRTYLDRYFAGRAGDEFTGRQFDLLAQRGDPNVIDANTLVAVQMLSVVAPAATAARLLLDASLRSRVTALLTDIPPTLTLGSHEAVDAIAPSSPADHLWRLLTSQTGIGWVTAGKLVAAKRPRLIPILDAKVKGILDYGKGSFWMALHEQLAEHHDQLAAITDVDTVPDYVTLPRRIDVALWMHATQGS